MEPSPPPKPVFVSYARERAAEANEWRRALPEGQAFVCHTDMQERASSFASERTATQRSLLESQIVGAEVVLILWDHNYSRAAWCAWELLTAVKQSGILLLLHQLDATPVPADLLDRVVVVRDAAAVAGAREDARKAGRRVANPYAESPILYPAASLLEARRPARFDASTQGIAEIAKRFGSLLLALLAQYLTYRLGMRWLSGGSTEHLWAIIVAVCVAMTIANAFMLSAKAAIVSGLVGMTLGMLAMTVAVHLRGAPTPATVTKVAAGIGTFQVSTSLFVRGWLLGDRFAARERGVTTRAIEWRGHGAALMGALVVAGLLVYGLHALDVIIEDNRRRQVSPGDLFEMPVVFGRRVGFLAGIALGLAVFRRILRNARETARWRFARAGTGALVACVAGVAIGWITGWWIQHHNVEAISKWGGSYAGAQIGVLLAVGVSVPVAAGTGRIGVRQEHVWGLLGAALVVAIIALKVQSFPFAASPKDAPRDILVGALLGLAPVGLVLALTNRRGRLLGVAAAAHAALALLLAILGTSRAADIQAPVHVNIVELPMTARRDSPPVTQGTPSGDPKGPPAPTKPEQTAAYREEVARELKKEIARARRSAIAREQRTIRGFEEAHGIQVGLIGGSGENCKADAMPCIDTCGANAIRSASTTGIDVLVPPHHTLSVHVKSGAGIPYELEISCDGVHEEGGPLQMAVNTTDVSIEGGGTGKVCAIVRRPAGARAQWACPQWSVEDGPDSDFDEPAVTFAMQARSPAAAMTDHEVCRGKCLKSAKRTVATRTAQPSDAAQVPAEGRR